MEVITKDNVDQAILPATWPQMEAELAETVQALVEGATGGQPASGGQLPIWYVLTKASGATGIPITTLYSDPVARQHALAVMAADSKAAQRIQELAEQ